MQAIHLQLDQIVSDSKTSLVGTSRVRQAGRW